MNDEKLYKSKVIDFLFEEETPVEWSEFINAALFHPSLGYYADPHRKRVGGDCADFFTSASMRGKVFSSLLKVSAKKILQDDGKDFSDFRFVEIGAEPNCSMIENSRVIRLFDKIEIPQNSIVISNELLDARPFDRFKFSNGVWQKGFVEIKKHSEKSGENIYACKEIFDVPLPEELEVLQKYFSDSETENFRIDISFDALEIFKNICQQTRGGLILFADYFRSVQELSMLTEGSARTYFRHTCGSDLFENAGSADITYSPCSDILIDIAKEYGAKTASCTNQEKFFMLNAEDEIKSILELSDPFNPRKRELCQLLSPDLMGSIFRVLQVC